MNVTIRTARTSDRKQFEWRTYYEGVNGPYRPQVVTVDGVLYLAMEGDRVVYQNGSAAVPDLVRMVRRLRGSMQTLWEDAEQRKRDGTERRLAETLAYLRGDS